jgi:hypothetical protein
MKKYILIIVILLNNLFISCISMSNSSRHEDIFVHKQFFYNIVNNYCIDNNIPLLIENEKIILIENISEKEIILFIDLINMFIEVYVKNLAYSNKVKLELEYINRQLVIHETVLVENYYVTDDEWRKVFGIYLEMYNFTREISNSFYEQCKIKGLKYPVFIPKENNTILLLEYIINNEYIIIDDNCYYIISTNNEENKIINLIEYIFIYIDVVKENIINNNCEFVDNMILFSHLNYINEILIENLEDYNQLAEYHQKIDENREFKNSYLRK